MPTTNIPLIVFPDGYEVIEVSSGSQAQAGQFVRNFMVVPPRLCVDFTIQLSELHKAQPNENELIRRIALASVEKLKVALWQLSRHQTESR